MSTPNPLTPQYTPGTAPAVTTISALAALEQDARWIAAGEQERAVMRRIAMQRDRLLATKQAQLQAKALRAQVTAVPVDAPLSERLVVFAKLHPVATAAVAGVALMIGPRKLLRWGALALPIITKLKR